MMDGSIFKFPVLSLPTVGKPFDWWGQMGIKILPRLQKEQMDKTFWQATSQNEKYILNWICRKFAFLSIENEQE